MDKRVQVLVVDTTAFIQNAPLHEIAEEVVTVQRVVDEVTSKRQLRQLVALPYDLKVKDAHPENVKVVTDFSKKTGDYPSLSATDIQVMALAFQLEKERVGTEHLKTEPTVQRSIGLSNGPVKTDSVPPSKIGGFHMPKDDPDNTEDSCDHVSEEGDLQVEDILPTVTDDPLEADQEFDDSESGYSDDDDDEDDDGGGWITAENIHKVKKQLDDDAVEEKPVVVACMTTDFAMQNVLKQMGLNVAALDGRIIKHLRTFILRCFTCFKTTSLMDKVFCPKCGNKTLKKVSVSLDENGKQVIHINTRRPLSARGKKFSLPMPKGGKHSNNPMLVEDQPLPQQRISKQARMKNNPLDPDYIAGYSPFVTRDVNSRSALLGIRPGQEVKYWMKKNPNQARRRRK